MARDSCKVGLSLGLTRLAKWSEGESERVSSARVSPSHLAISLLLPDEFQNFVRRIPTFYALNASAIQYFWKTEPTIHNRYRQLELGAQQLLSKARRIINKLFSLSKRCQTQPKIIMLRERWEADKYSRPLFLLIRMCRCVCVCV